MPTTIGNNRRLVALAAEKKNMVEVCFKPAGRKVWVQGGSTLLEAAEEAGIAVRSECGGEGICGKCKIIVKDSDVANEVTEAEMKHLSRLEINSGYRLACRSRIWRDATVMIPFESRLITREFQVGGLEKTVDLSPAVNKFYVCLPEPTLSDVRSDLQRLIDVLSHQSPDTSKLDIDYRILRKLAKILRDADWKVTITVWHNRRIIAVEPGDTSDKLFGLALDVGTSKIVAHLVNLMTGETTSAVAVENPQTTHGEDIVTRLAFGADEVSLRKLQKLSIQGINKLIQEACVNARVDSNSIYEVVAVGNTAMHHLLLAVQANYLALSPFAPVVKRLTSVPNNSLNTNLRQTSMITFLPIIAGFVGSDTIADALTTGIHESNELSLLIDIGTNTEVLVGNSDDIISCSCASGPAFEGAHIKHGVKAVRGAIEKVQIDSNSKVHYSTIGNTRPLGLCGSAMIDIVASMFKSGIIDDRGRFKDRHIPRIQRDIGEKEFVIVSKEETATSREITVTQKDINEIQLAKAAIFAGCSILTKRKDIELRDLDRVFIAGAFGNGINLENARLIGLIPDLPIKKVTFVGNAAISGAKIALVSKKARDTANILSKRIRYCEITLEPDFKTEFAHAMFIPHKDLSRFPSVKEMLKGV